MRFHFPLLTLCAAALVAPLHAEDMPGLREQVLAARDTPAAAAFEKTVTRILTAPGAQIMVRPYRGEDVGVKGRSWLDPRAKPQSPEVREIFGLSMSDQNQASVAANEVPILAAASVLGLGGEALVQRLDDQLAEMSTWSPMQREGWTLTDRDAKLRYNPAGERLPVNDGNSWLATGWGIRAIVDTLEILGDDPLGQKHRPALLALLAKEVGFISDDWRQKRPWFVKSNMTRTNQWMLPTEGLIRACLATGRGPGDADYELGVANLLTSLNDFGAAGEFDEGLSYAMHTIPSALGAARAMARAGDNRAVHHPFLKSHPLWFVHHFQPGRQVINCFDANSGMAIASRDQRGYRDMLATYAFMLVSADARWALFHLFDGPYQGGVLGLITGTLTAPPAEPAPVAYAAYERATRVNWRSSWADDASGVWVRGGHEKDFHDHFDRGHVNVILHGRPVLIETDNANYAAENFKTYYHARIGHNVIDLKGRPAPSSPAPAPITVARLDATGGEVTVNPTPGYRRVEKWERKVSWSAERAEIHDLVAVANEGTETIVAYWHTGSSTPVELSGEGAEWTARWADAVLTFRANTPIVVTQTQSPDRTLIETNNAPDHLHAFLTVTTADKVARLELITTAALPEPAPSPTPAP